MPKLHLKRTPEEEAAHQVRKQQKNGARRKRRHHNIDHSDGDFPSSSSSKRHRTREDGYPMKWASSDEDEQETEYGPQPPPTTPDSTKFRPHKVDYEQIRAEVEERRFREKMFDALGDDERLDTVEARLNDFAHVPGRWRRVGGKQSGGAWDDDGLGGIDQGNDSLSLDPRYMDDEEYAEWIRAGMYRKTHADEYAEQQRRKSLNAARRAKETARQSETVRLEKAAEVERSLRKKKRERQRWDYAREEYDLRWKELLTPAQADCSKSVKQITFNDVPWPVLAAHRQRPDKCDSTSTTPVISPDDLTAEAIASFLLSPGTGAKADGEKGQKERKEKLRETFLRFHPDKFEGRFMERVRQSEKEKIREAIGQVVRVLNNLMGVKT